MSIKTEVIKTTAGGTSTIFKNIIHPFSVGLLVCNILLTSYSYAQSVSSFDPSPLVNQGDSVTYGSYIIIKIREGIYKISDPGRPPAIKGGAGVDMYMICGQKKALWIDLGNNYTDGYEKDLIPPRKNAAEEIRNVAFGLAGKLTLEIAFTHTGPDHEGMTNAFVNMNVPMWLAKGEDGKKVMNYFGNIDTLVYTRFNHGEKSFDLGGGRVVETIMVRGHSFAGTVFIIKKDGILITGDAIGFGNGLSLDSVEDINGFRADMQNLVKYIYANYAPYERYSLKAFTGHSHLDTRGAIRTQDNIDAGFMDWRYIQNMSSCANAIAKGMWLTDGSPLFCVRRQPAPTLLPAADEVVTFVYGIGSLKIPIGLAYEVAGLKMPEVAIK